MVTSSNVCQYDQDDQDDLKDLMKIASQTIGRMVHFHIIFFGKNIMCGYWLVVSSVFLSYLVTNMKSCTWPAKRLFTREEVATLAKQTNRLQSAVSQCNTSGAADAGHRSASLVYYIHSVPLSWSLPAIIVSSAPCR